MTFVETLKTKKLWSPKQVIELLGQYKSGHVPDMKNYEEFKEELESKKLWSPKQLLDLMIEPASKPETGTMDHTPMDKFSYDKLRWDAHMQKRLTFLDDFLTVLIKRTYNPFQSEHNQWMGRLNEIKDEFEKLMENK